MPRQRYTTEQIIDKLREAEVLPRQEQAIGQVSRGLGIGDHTYHHWLKERGPSDGPYATAEDPGAGVLLVEEALGGPVAGQRYLAGGGLGKLTSPARRRRPVDNAQEMFAISERRACRAVGQPRSSQRYAPRPSEAEERLTESIVSPATQYGWYGSRRITALLQWDRWQVNHMRVERT